MRETYPVGALICAKETYSGNRTIGPGPCASARSTSLRGPPRS